MTVFVMELDDRALSLAREGRVLSSAPSVVFDGATGGLSGSSAWRELRRRPMSTSSRHLGSILTQRISSTRAQHVLTAELRARLAEYPIVAGDRVWIATPARVEATGLESILAVTRALDVPVDGFVDSATAVTAGLGPDRNAIVLELGLHHAAATAMDCEGGQARRRRTVLTERGGFLDLQQAWLDLISKAMVKRTRFDPLHDAATEQQLFDAMPALTAAAAQQGATSAVVIQGEERFEVPLTRDQFAQAAEPIYRSILALLHQLRPAGSSVDIVLPLQVLGLPGLRQHLEEFVGCTLVGVPDGFAAAAASLLDLPLGSADQGVVRMLRRLPLQQPTQVQTLAIREELGRRRSGGPAPSHVLLDGRAYPLSAESLVVGRAPIAGGVELPDGLAGVSRRHCTFVHDADELILLDHSTFGTFVNGERVRERVRVHAGDRVRLGEPGVELALIAVGEPHAAPT
jgi:hypothetical protein